MEEIRLEVVIDDGEFEGDKEDAEELVERFLDQTGDNIEAKYTTVYHEEDQVSEELKGYDRKSEICWTSIAILLISNPEGVIQFFKWAAEIPGLTMGFTVEGDVRIKLFEKVDFTLIDNSTEYNVTKVEETEDYVIAKIPQEDWTYLYDDVYTGELDIELPPEDEIGP